MTMMGEVESAVRRSRRCSVESRLARENWHDGVEGNQ
jgi:hypothetical protein